MSDDVKVSVIIPTYNRAGIVTRAIDSVLGQTYRAREVIVVDDGSTDGTADVLRAYGRAVVPVFQANAGPSAARNRGIREAQGDFIAFLDSDDLWRPTKLQRQVDLLRRAGPAAPCCLCDTLFRFPHQPEQTTFQVARLKLSEPEGLWLNPAQVLATRFVLFCQAALIRREFLLDCGGFDEQLWAMEDHDLALRLALRGPWAYVRDPLAVWCGANDDGNLSVAALKEPARLYRSIEYIDGKILAQERIPDAQVRKFLERDLRLARWRLRAERWRASGRLLARLGVKGILGASWLERKWFVYMGSCPGPQTAPIPDGDRERESYDLATCGFGPSLGRRVP